MRVSVLNAAAFFLLFISLPGVAAAESCHPTGAYLETVIPQFSEPSLAGVRRQILGQDIAQMMREGNARGYTPDQWIGRTIEMAKQFESSFSDSLVSFNQSTATAGMDDDTFLDKLRSDGSTTRTDFSGVSGSALLAAISLKLGAVATMAFAADMRCAERSNRWPSESTLPPQGSTLQIAPTPKPLEPSHFANSNPGSCISGGGGWSCLNGGGGDVTPDNRLSPRASPAGPAMSTTRCKGHLGTDGVWYCDGAR